MRARLLILPVLTAVAITGIVAWGALQPFARQQPRAASIQQDLPTAVRAVDQILESQWRDAGVEPAAEADELQVFRRLSLALVGTIPSLEEVREFNADLRSDRLDRWTVLLLNDWRFVEYFGDQMAKGLVNDADTEFRDNERQQFVEWLGHEIQQGRPYDAMVREMIANRGLWANDPAVLFIRSELVQTDLVPQRLAARTSRAFLGQQIGCAQCHDHPFADWKQSQFEGLAAHFAQVRHSQFGIQDERSAVFVIDDQRSQQRTINATVPFDPQNVPAKGTARERFAAWITHRENRRFRRATANLVWGLMFGRPYIQPVDDIPDPPPLGETDNTELLDVLGDDWATHGYDLRRLIQTIAASRPFRLGSDHASLEVPDDVDLLRDSWAVFPITQLNSQQLMRSLQQASSLKTVRIREESSTYTYVRGRELMRQATERYGETGDMNEPWQTGSINQAVARLIGSDFSQASESGFPSAAGRISAMAASNEDCLSACYLVCLTRPPVDVERHHFMAQLDEALAGTQHRIVEDIFWTLFNSPEFSWNH
jgi:hypothetical protein